MKNLNHKIEFIKKFSPEPLQQIQNLRPNLLRTSKNQVKKSQLNISDPEKPLKSLIAGAVPANFNSSWTSSNHQVSKTVPLSDYEGLSLTVQEPRVIPSPLDENWLYMSHSHHLATNPCRNRSSISDSTPDWFKISETPSVKNHSIENSIGFDGAVTVLSRISGWMTVSPSSRNRAKRLARHFPFDKTKKGPEMQNNSDLAPIWMQSKYPRNQPEQFKVSLPHPCQRKERKRLILVEKEQEKKSVFSFGDFRHNVMTKEEVKEFEKGLKLEASNLIKWNEDLIKQRYDKKLSGKIGSLS